MSKSAGKRSQDGEGNSSSAKRQKQDGGALVKSAKALQVQLPLLEKIVQDMKADGLDIKELRAMIGYWAMITQAVVDGGTLTDFSSFLVPPEGAAKPHVLAIEFANSLYATLCDLYAKLTNTRSSPSHFSKYNVWPGEQAKIGGLLCLRPPERIGIPLSAMHSVFRTFLTQQNVSLPKECDSADAALRVAHLLCNQMGESFEDESQRSQAFHKCMEELFPSWASFIRLKSSSEAHSGYPDHSQLLAKLLPGIIAEHKNEVGTSQSDVYLQLARDYELLVSSLTDKKKKHTPMTEAFVKSGIPVFLVGLLGPILLVAGGFYDGKNVIVEPLGRPCFLLEDHTGRRQEEAARVLWSLKQGKNELQRIYNSSQRDVFPPDTPRLYPSCSLVGQPAEEGKLRFIGPLAQNSSNPHHLLYDAILSYPSAPADLKVAVKLVNSQYGEDAHQFLARHNFAPILYGRSQLEDAPTAYVMEKLGSNWMSLFDLEEKEGALIFKDAIRVGLDEILVLLEKAGFVHGDLRAINIMVEIDEKKVPVVSEAGKVKLKMIDFDWSGRSGQVHYPATRNEDIKGIEWPGAPGGTIEAGHDRQLVDSWWPEFFETKV